MFYLRPSRYFYGLVKFVHDYYPMWSHRHHSRIYIKLFIDRPKRLPELHLNLFFSSAPIEGPKIGLVNSLCITVNSSTLSNPLRVRCVIRICRHIYFRTKVPEPDAVIEFRGKWFYSRLTTFLLPTPTRLPRFLWVVMAVYTGSGIF